MLELRKQVYLLGQIYGRLCDAAKIKTPSPTDYDRACKMPLVGITLLYCKKHSMLSEKDEEYLTLRFDEIDASNDAFEKVLPMELQGTFQIGYHHAKSKKNDDINSIINGSDIESSSEGESSL